MNKSEMLWLCNLKINLEEEVGAIELVLILQ